MDAAPIPGDFEESEYSMIPQQQPQQSQQPQHQQHDGYAAIREPPPGIGPPEPMETRSGGNGETTVPEYTELLKQMEEEERQAKEQARLQQQRQQAEAERQQLQQRQEMSRRKKQQEKQQESTDTIVEEEAYAGESLLSRVWTTIKDIRTLLVGALIFALLFFMPRIRAVLPRRLIDAGTGKINYMGYGAISAGATLTYATSCALIKQ